VVVGEPQIESGRSTPGRQPKQRNGGCSSPSRSPRAALASGRDLDRSNEKFSDQASPVSSASRAALAARQGARREHQNINEAYGTPVTSSPR
jgi:hypothetical protein